MTDKTHRPVNPNRRKFLKDASLIPAGLYLGASAAGASAQGSSPQSGAGETMMDYAAPALDTVRVGVIGAGRRGTTILRLLAGIDGVDVKAICDSYAPAIDRAKSLASDLALSIAGA